MNINGYELIGNLQNDKSGYAKWGFARKNGIEVFIKEFLSPVYPVDDSEISKEQIQRKREICASFEKEKRKFYDELGKCLTGNIITVLDFFRSGSRFYIVTEKVDAASIDVKEIAKLKIEQKILISKIVLHNISTLHSHNIVHGDIKPDNILLKKTVKGSYTAKIIDFDSGFLEGSAPQAGDDLQGDMVYLSPEAFMFIANEAGTLTKKIDIFSLGILLHQYFCGEIPEFDKEKYDYLFEAVLDDGEIKISDEIPDYFKSTLLNMLSKHPASRPQASEILQLLQQDVKKVDAKESIKEPIEGDRLREIIEEAEYKLTGLKSGENSAESKSALKSTMRKTNDEKKTDEENEYTFFRKADDLL